VVSFFTQALDESASWLADEDCILTQVRSYIFAIVSFEPGLKYSDYGNQINTYSKVAEQRRVLFLSPLTSQGLISDLAIQIPRGDLIFYTSGQNAAGYCQMFFMTSADTSLVSS
jgi:hypothetical protein